MIKAKSAKAKGHRLEKQVASDLTKAGLKARLQPGSGIYTAFPHDVQVEIHGKRYIVECKARKDSFRQLDSWLGAADILVVRCDRAEPRVYMSWSAFLEIVGEDEEEEEESDAPASRD